MNPNRLRAAGNGTIAAFVFIVLSTLYAELNAPFKGLLATTFGHHWVGKGILSIVVFALVYYYFSAHSSSSGKFDSWKAARNVGWGAVLGGIIIFLFYLWEFFK
jgi:hypothetical protein